jgi:CxxC motif-containing protein (DUF1111 family)
MLLRPVAVAVTVALTGVGLASVVAQSPSFQSQPNRAARTGPSPTPVVPKPNPQFGDPLPGLTAAQLADFAEGLADFQEVDTVASGLGPVFNNTSCVACHSVPAIGGGSAILETRFGRMTNGQFDPLTDLGGSLLQQFAIDPSAQEKIPSVANVTAKRITTPLFGLGLIEAIPDALILVNAFASAKDGISGRASVVVDVATGQTRIGRFGWKAQQATVLAFAGDAYLNEIGITSRLFPNENAPNGNAALLAKYDTVADPEDQVDPATGKADIDHFADFMRFLAPPPTAPLSIAARAGQQIFDQIGCGGCHTPAMATGPNMIAALDRKPVRLYSDLLLHDMGALGDGIGQGTAKPGEMKTAPLWGLHARGPFLHDGRAATVDAAIRMHDGEAARARDRYNQMAGILQQQLLAFLNAI